MAPAARHTRRASVIESLGFHTHAGYTDDIRSVRYSTALHTNSILNPLEICAQIDLILTNKRHLPNIVVEKRGKYVWVCKPDQTDFESKFVLEIEVVRIWLLKMTAVKFKRLGGDALNYKECCETITKLLNW